MGDTRRLRDSASGGDLGYPDAPAPAPRPQDSQNLGRIVWASHLSEDQDELDHQPPERQRSPPHPWPHPEDHDHSSGAPDAPRGGGGAAQQFGGAIGDPSGLVRITGCAGTASGDHLGFRTSTMCRHDHQEESAWFAGGRSSQRRCFRTMTLAFRLRSRRSCWRHQWLRSSHRISFASERPGFP